MVKKIVMANLTCYIIMLGIGLLMFGLNLIIQPTSFAFAQSTQGITISAADSSFVPLTNSDASQVRVVIKYSVVDESLKNEMINAVMAVFAPDGKLLRTTTFPSGFTAKSEGGTQILRTTFQDKSLTSVTANITFTDLAKTGSISNVLTVNLDLEEKGISTNEPKWLSTCKILEWGLMSTCEAYVNPDGSLTVQGQRAKGCITNGGLLGGAGILSGLPASTIIGILEPLSERTGCGGIVNWATLKSATNPMDFLNLLR